MDDACAAGGYPEDGGDGGDTQEHWLQDIWSFYYHRQDNASWTLDSYHRLGDVSTVEELWHMHRATCAYATCGMLFAMREHVFPCWDDKHNIDGGCLSIKVPMADVPAAWELLVKRMAGETLADSGASFGIADATDTAGGGPPINGISISPKRGFCIIKLWLGDCGCCGGARCVGCRSAAAGAKEFCAARGAGAIEGAYMHPRTATTFRLPDEYQGEVVYRSNRSNMQLDARRAQLQQLHAQQQQEPATATHASVS